MTDWNVVAVKKRRKTPGYDILGNIAVVDLEGVATASGKRIAGKILSGHKSVSTVLAKAGPVSGRYRVRRLRYIAGARRYTADYRENGCRFVFDVRKSFFSNRLAFERGRISSISMRKGKENVMVMFAGVGPFAIEIAKLNPNANVVAIELNNDAYAAMCGNIMINRVKNLTAVLGDVREVARRYPKFADRVVMPLPKDSLEFLDEAVNCCKRSATIHLYMLADRIDAKKKAAAAVREHANSHGYSARLNSFRIVRNYSPGKVEVALDIAVSHRRQT